MTISVSKTLSLSSVDALILPAFSDDLSVLDIVPAAAEAAKSSYLRLKSNDITPLFVDGRLVVVLGLGEKGKLTRLQWKRSIAMAFRYTRERGAKKVAVSDAAVAGEFGISAVSLLVTGAVTGLLRTDLHKTIKEPRPEVEKIVVVSEQRGASKAAADANIIAEATNWARSLINMPANELSPTVLSGQALAAAKEAGVKAKVLKKADIEKLGMAGLMAVSSSSGEPPTFTIFEYLPVKGEAPVVIVGKGITFDTGGISLKPGSDMHHMKDDMAGAAAVLGTVLAAAKLKLQVNIVALAPATENMPGGKAYRPSDVLKYANGKTVEVTNTDAEGRLILADALIYGEQKYKPRAIVDIATLTGACVVALGSELAGLFAKDDGVAEALLAASEETQEPLWRMPFYMPYRSKLDSPIADLDNSGERGGTSISSAIFLSEFVEKTPFAHVDIAGPSFEAKDKAYQGAGGTGYGLALLLEFARRYKGGDA